MNTIITIGRQFGSAGREIGEKVAAHFGIPCYDKELLSRAAKESGFCEEMIESHDERPTNSFLYNLVMDTYSFGYNTASFVDMPISQKVFLAQFDTIKKIASEGPCVIVGRCADFILKDYPNVLKLYVHAPLEHCIETVTNLGICPHKQAKNYIQTIDKRRSAYYHYFTGQDWKDADHYDLCLNTANLSNVQCINLVKAYLQIQFGTTFNK